MNKRFTIYSALKAKKEAEDRSVIYRTMVKKANEVKHFYMDRMGMLLKRLEEHEDERVQSLRAAVDKIIVYETSQEMNNKYDAKMFAKVADGIDGDKQLKFFKGKVNLLKVNL